MSNITRTARIGAVLLSAGVAAAPALGQGGPVVREGAGERRAGLNKLELAAFPSDAWNTLSDWVGGKTVTSADTKGSVVLICAYSDWYDPARRAWALARRMGAAKGKDGLVVVGVHHAQGWETAAKDLPKDSKIFLAHDAKGDFRKALLSDQDPDFYVIDRAGQLRFADIETESVDNAVSQLLGESVEAAAGLKAKMASDAAAADAEFRRSGANRDKIDLKTMPEVPFADPPKDAYERAEWPKKPVNPSSYGTEDATPKTIQLPQTGPFFPKPPVMKGRAIVIYVWSPDVRQSYEKIMPLMDRLQAEHGRDVAIVGAAMFKTDDRSGATPLDPKDAAKRVQSFLSARSFEHTLTLYQDGMVGARETYGQDDGTSTAVVASSNGVIRWSGRPDAPGLIAALEQVIAADPAVKARRAAEDEYIKARSK